MNTVDIKGIRNFEKTPFSKLPPGQQECIIFRLRCKDLPFTMAAYNLAQRVLFEPYRFLAYCEEMEKKLLECFQCRVIRHVEVDYDKEPKDVFAHLETDQGENQKSLDLYASLSRTEKGRWYVSVEFFTPCVRISHKEADELCQAFGYNRLANPYELAVANCKNFAIKHPNYTHWQDKDGEWSSLVFYESTESPGKVVYGAGIDHYDYSPGEWLAGVHLAKPIN